uniref:C2H2-type domain-containing protein n=1 Tax=Caenorhabditis tropicalis TaxID=1561998 RepID=A0A1I7TBE7_9PELO
MNLVDKVACDGEENATYSAREALIAANMLIINTTRANQNELGSIVCRCESCELLVVVNAETWQIDVFTNHMFSDEHKRRTVLIKENTVSAFGIQTKKSDYTVKPLDQKDKTKLQKVTWQWKDQSKQHEYVASVVGLDCVIERRYPSMEFGIPKQGSDFYCQICAVVFQKRHESLHSHVRSLDHCVNWIHKYRPSHIRDLLKHQANQSVDKGKDLRKFLLSVLKDVNPPEDYCMLVYDPIGEEERKQLAIMTKIQAEERRKTKMIKEAEKAEILKKREEDRRQKEEQMRKQREREQDEEKAKKALREARLKYAKEHVGKYQNKETPEEAALKNRLAHATSLENQKKRFDLQKAKLEAEKTQLLSTNPYAAVSNAPKLVVMPQLRTQPQPQSPYGNIAGVPPPSLNVQPPVAFFGTRPPIIQQIQPTGGLSMTFSKSITDHTPATKELAAYKKRPSLRGKRVDPAIHNTVAISNKTDLLNYMRRQGADEIVDPSEIPREFSQSVQDSPDAFGIEYVAEVVCLDDTALDSYLCTVCDCWSDPKGMLRHLSSTDHKSTYMYHKYPHYHAEVNREKDPVVRRNVFKNFTKDLKGKNVADVVNTRMKTLLDKETIARLWVGYEEYFFSKSTSSSWSSGGFKPVSGPSVVLPKVVPVERLINDDDDDDGDENHAMNLDRREVTRKRTDSSRRDRSRDRSRRSRSREYDRRQSRRRSRTRSRSRSSVRYYRDRSRRDRRSRSRSCSESRSRSRSPECPPKKLRTDSWTAQTDSFLAKLGSDVSVLPTAAPQVSTESTTAADFNSKLATVRDLAASGHIQGTQIDSLAASPQKEPAPVVPTQSTEDRRRMEREKAEYEANLSRKVMGALMLLDQLFKEYEGNVPNHLISDIYKQVGLNESEGDEAMQKFLQSINNKNPMVPKQTITQSISSLGIQLNTTPVNVKYNQADSHYPQQAGPSIHPQQYGISSQPQTSSSAYSQAFHGSTVQTARPLSPISAAIVPLRSSTVYAQQHQQPTQSFYQNPPTAMNHDIKSSEASIANNRSNDSDDSSDDEDYKEVYQLLGTKKSQTQQKKETNVLQKEQLEEPIIPGQKMALKRTILPNGARVGEVQAVQLQPTVVASPTPSDASTTNLVIRTPNSAATDSTQVAQDIPQIIRPTLESSLGMPAPITVTKQVQQPIHQPQMVNYLPHQQGYQMNVPVSMYQHQPVYQQPPMQPPMQPQINYQQQQQVYQQPPSQPHYPQQYVHQPQMYQHQPQQQPGYPQQYYQQPPPQQYYQQPLQQVQHPLSQQQQPVQSNVAPTYGISGAPQQPQQYYWPPR